MLGKSVRIAIHAHVFYPDLWSELARCIRNFPVDVTDVFLTYPDTLPTSVGDDLHRDFPNATVRRLENRGYDIGPFVEVVSGLNLDAYDIVIKLHTKRNRRAIVKFLPYWGSQWRLKLLAFCATPDAVRRTLDTFASAPSVGMVGHGDLIMHASDELTPGAADTPAADDHTFVAGTMFAVRAKLLKRLVAEVTFADFPVMQGRTNSNLAWEWERRLGRLVEEQGYLIAGVPAIGLVTRIIQRLAKRAYEMYSKFSHRSTPKRPTGMFGIQA